MKAIASLVLTVAICAIVFSSCSSTATLNRTQTSNTYANKLPLRAAAYIPPDLTNRKIVVSPSTQVCSMWKAEITSGDGYYSALESGLSAALQSVDIIKVAPSPEIARTGRYDLLITANLANENSSVTATESFLTNTLNSQFQVSFTLTFADSAGQSLYSYTANGSGFNNVSGSCSDIAASAKISMETALRQVADYISQSTYGSAQLSEYAKRPR
jgi:hypothetical protein